MSYNDCYEYRMTPLKMLEKHCNAFLAQDSIVYARKKMHTVLAVVKCFFTIISLHLKFLVKINWRNGMANRLEIL